ncbi:hypothetical protein SMACR_00882 [Sordaria macrospora]|nr:hypothetical protein SMACR_00882 [Sordaria macrospora]WPJ62123.1 hypothetical protein SMAC4_00882 [Sordaria macrospora]
MMLADTPPSPSHHPNKRPRQSSPERESPTSVPSGEAPSPANDLLHDGSGATHGGQGGGSAGGKAGQSSSFRNVSACNRCRLRKNRCDQKLPSCASCEKANVACVGYDPITKREIPRSYIFYLEKRVEQLENLLKDNNITYPPAENLDYCSKKGDRPRHAHSTHGDATGHPSQLETPDSTNNPRPQNEGDDVVRLQKLVSKSDLAGVSATANPRHLGSTSGISFARVVFAAVQSSVSDQKSTSDKAGIRPYKPAPTNNGPAAAGTSMRDSFFGLHTKPTIHPATFPSRALGEKLVLLYFEHANPQIPVLHKGEFMEMFEQAYAEENRVRGPRELYMLNMVFAIGGGIIVGESTKASGSVEEPGKTDDDTRQCQPEEYHASAIVHLEACLGNSAGGLEELQAVLLLANFALLRPVPPGLWYIVGVAVRLAVDLGLHYEDGKDIESGLGMGDQSEAFSRERGRREYMRDLRRRLWWCTYSLDRLVSVCVGRPFGISDQVITTEFPSLLDDRFITPSGLLEPPPDVIGPTYKLIAHHYFRLRLLQSEILQVLQFQQSQLARSSGLNQKNPYMHTSLPSPFLSQFETFRAWRIDIDRRLWEWKNSAPTRQQTGVQFSPEFFDLNYWQAVIMLYRQSLSVPALFEGEYHTSKEVNSPTMFNMELREDEDRVYLKVAEAGQRILRLYRQLHRVGLVNYTYLATHHLFMAGISYLYAIWHSPIVRSRLTVDEVDFTILAAKSVFTDLMDKCPPAEACRDAFDRTAKATIKMANSTGGFGQGQDLSGGYGHNTHTRRPGGSIDQRFDWSSQSDSAASSLQHYRMQQQQHQQQQQQQQHRHHQQHRHRPPMLRNPSSQYSDLASDAYSVSSASQLSAFQQAAQFRAAAAAAIKTEQEGGFSLMRNLPQPPRSNASSVAEGGPIAQSPAGETPIDPSLMPSPSAIQQHQQRQGQGLNNTLSPPAQMAGSPITGSNNPQQQQQQRGGTPGYLQQQQQQQQQTYANSPGALSFSDLQGLEFLQGVDGGGGTGGMDGSNGGGDLSSLNMNLNPAEVVGQMDLGFGIGWEGNHHDFSDGQQLDLFEGFFFGGQQGGGGGAGGGGAGGGN